jgi:hypothetical protein
MPINFVELENLIIEWKKRMNAINIKKPIEGRTARWVYNNIKEKTNKEYSKLIFELFRLVDIDQVDANKDLKPDRTYENLMPEVNVVINKSSL